MLCVLFLCAQTFCTVLMCLIHQLQEILLIVTNLMYTPCTLNADTTTTMTTTTTTVLLLLKLQLKIRDVSFTEAKL